MLFLNETKQQQIQANWFFFTSSSHRLALDIAVSACNSQPNAMAFSAQRLQLQLAEATFIVDCFR